jgi:ATP-dependent RNA helicase DeaD
MNESGLGSTIGAALAGALERKGYTRLTSVQEAVLDEALDDRDLRITSQTGSGKTVAIGLVLRGLIEAAPAMKKGMARPVAMVVAPTRELAKQVEQELSWLYAAVPAKVASATGGASYHEEGRALASGPAIVVGTPGRLLDHLGRGVIDPIQLKAIVLDEADRMLDLGFREELEAILKYAPAGHRTHLISATFPSGVRSLADRVQVDPAHVQGTPLGAANADIDHVVHLVDPRERVDAIVNLLLANPDEQTLVFARTRLDVARTAKELREAGFAVSSISGEMEQPERNRALADFKRGKLRVLVATDVAARGIDVQDIGRVIHADPPDDADSYTHRSGRTGRAGRKGRSSVLVSPSGLTRTSILLKRARVRFRIEPIPTADDIQRSLDDRYYAALTEPDPDGFAGYEPRLWALAEKLAESRSVTRTLARLLSRTSYAGTCTPRQVRAFAAPAERAKARHEEAPKSEPRDVSPVHRAAQRKENGTFVPFRVSWGKEQGADARRLLAMACRRGGIQGTSVGIIRIARGFSVVEIATDVAEAFAHAAGQPDPRNPRVFIKRDVAPSVKTDATRERTSHGPTGTRSGHKRPGYRNPR